MIVQVEPSSLRQTKWHEYAIRFLFGGLITAIVGELAKHFGPGVGGLFLAFPSIFPATLTLASKHEKEKKARQGMPGEDRGKEAASAEAAGTSIGSIGLLAFALVVWFEITRHSSSLVLLLATGAWVVGSMALWWFRKRV